MKAILILNKMPENCEDCELCRDGYLCLRLGEVDESIENGTKDLRCPLKPFNEKALKVGNKEYIIYQRDYLYKNIDREIEQLKMSKKYYETNMIGEKE